MEKDGSIVAVLLDDVENMFKHPRADTESSVRRQASQGHYVELQLTVRKGLAPFTYTVKL